MQRVWIIASLKKATLLSMQEIFQTHGILSTAKLLPRVSMLLNPKSIHMTFTHCNNSSASSATVAQDVRLGYMQRLFKKIGFLNLQKYRYMVLACLVYEHMLNPIDYYFFYEKFNMPDTLFSWFLVTELHTWMLMVRYMAEGKDGLFIRNNIVTAMWDDTKARIEKLGTIPSNIKQKQITELSSQFNAAIVGYDEGILSDDKVLAGALWRRFFYHKGNDPEHIELLLTYVRIQISLLDSIPTKEILHKPNLKLVDIKSLCKH